MVGDLQFWISQIKTLHSRFKQPIISHMGLLAASSSPPDNYKKRFSRNIGILSPDEQTALSGKTVGVAGVGGLGGHALTNLARMGIGNFVIADIDSFDLSNINRQIGASEQSLGVPKLDVMAQMIRDINPAVKVRCFHDGINPASVNDFVRQCDIVIDSLDFFCLTGRRLLYDACERQQKTVVLSAPLGFSSTLHVFSPTSMTTSQFFGWTPDMDKFEQLIQFAAGISPSGLHLSYLKFERELLVEKKTGPSISSACSLGGALVATETLACLLQRRKPFQAPAYTQFDPYVGRYKRGRLLWGNRGLVQRIKIFLAKKYYGNLRDQFLDFIK